MQLRRWIIGFGATLAASLALAAVDVNKATEAELDGLKGIGPATSRLIIKERQTAPFADWQDLNSRVKGFGPKRSARLSEQGLTVNGKPWTESGKKPEDKTGKVPPAPHKPASTPPSASAQPKAKTP